MKQYFKQTQQHADYGAGVMESGDHSTNGANPKSLTSRRNFLLMPDAGDRRKTKSIMNGTMKFLSMALIVAITMFSLSGCSKDEDEDDVSKEDYDVSIVGTWRCSSGFYSDGREFSGSDLLVVFVFDQDGTMTLIDANDHEYYDGTYSISGDTLIMYANNRVGVYEIISLEKNKLVILDGNQSTITFTKS
jgi:hypothetical protein